MNQRNLTLVRGDDVVALLQSQVDVAPDAVAISGPEGDVSYAALWWQAARIAAGLCARGFAAGDVVVVQMQPGSGRVAAMLGVLRAGMIFCPSDPEAPAARSRYILTHVDAAVVVTDSQNGDDAAVSFERLLLDGDCLGPRVDRRASDVLAYLVHTSGSSGQPKGVLVGMRALTNFLLGVAPRYDVGPRDAVLQFASPEFDASIEEVLVCLTAGARLVVDPKRARGSVPEFLDLCRVEKVTVLDLPTAFWHHLATELVAHGIELPSDVRRVIIGGEQARADLVDKWPAVAPDAYLVNSYGPSEATIVVSTAPLDGTQHGEVPPIGLPIEGARFDVLGPGLEPCVEGELWIGGPTLAVGYWDAPASTADRFRPTPGSTGPGVRSFRTGDRVRRADDGSLTFLGRLDDQVKIAGHRVEPAEIEEVLRLCDLVSDAIVVPQWDSTGTVVRSLAAFVVAKGESPTVEQISSVLADLPAAVRPTLMREIPALPLGATGKVDRKALDPDRDGLPLRRSTPFVAPRDAIEAWLCRTWEELTGTDEVSTLDTFLSLGGDSMKAMRCMTRLRAELGVELPLSEILRGSSVAEIAARCQPGKGVQHHPAASAGRFRGAPLSLSQERVWFLTELEPENPAYQFQMALRLRGPLQLDILSDALAAVLNRHEILRTSVESVGSEPRQIVHPTIECPLTVLDMATVVASGGVDEVIRRECARPFNLERLPLLRWTLLPVAANDHVLVHVEHHLVHDGWSLSQLLDDLQFAYSALANGKEARWDGLAPSYSAYAREQREWLSSEQAQAQRRYWAAQLEGVPPVTSIPTDRPRRARQSFHGRVIKRAIPAELVRSVREAAGRHETTAFVVMMAAFAVIVHRWNGQRDLAIGTSVANRADQRWDGLVGMMVNNVVLRLAVTPEMYADELVRDVRTAMLGALDHQELPFEAVVDDNVPERDLATNPLFQLMFSFHDAPVGELKLGPVRGQVRYLDNESAKFDLNVVVIPAPSTLSDGPQDGSMMIEWEYNADLFDAATVEGVVDAYEEALRACAARERSPIEHLVLTSAEDERAVLDLGRPRSSGSTAEGVDLWSSVVRRARLQPDLVAIEAADGQITYGALTARATQVARLLSQRGIGPEDVVAIAAGRTPSMVAGLLAALLCGAAFLLLDDDLPASRRDVILKDSGSAAVVVARHGGGIEVVDLRPPQPACVPRAERAPGTLAYLMYTSGSTGLPKGVMATREGLAHYLAWCARSYGLGVGDMVPVHTALGVDLTITSLLSPLTVGARLLLLADGYAGMESLTDLVLEGRVELVKLTPTHLRVMAAQGITPPDRALTLVVGGEALVDRDLIAWPHQTRVVNEYGPTETVVGCVTAEVGGQGATAGASLPIGTPMDHVTAHVVDGRRATPRGAVGELAIGGNSVARGYRNQPGETANAFRPDPYSVSLGARRYMTGDRARWTGAGQLDYLGRGDRQMKVRGRRVDPAEIENVLMELRGGGTAIVVLTGEDLSQRLVAYVERRQDSVADDHIEIENLRRAAAARLPRHMVPDVVVMLDRLPVAAGGKVATADLPAMRPKTVVVGTGPLVLPATETEKKVTAIWRDVLMLAECGPQTDFFVVGGHSLAAVRVVARLRELGYSGARVHDIFDSRTVRGLAARLDKLRAESMALRPTVAAQRPTDGMSDAEVAQRLAELTARQSSDR